MTSIAIIGASQNQDKYSNKAVKACKDAGLEVFPVNPNYQEVNGLRCYASIINIEEDLDFVSIYLPPEKGIALVTDIVAKGIKKVILNPGAESEELINALKKSGIEPLLICTIISAKTLNGKT
ncbi:MAG: CoA-binding protein [Nanoarchaeota archaeon]|nr:CoA-binding protein [Nanoarchaeota archaeon]